MIVRFLGISLICIPMLAITAVAETVDSSCENGLKETLIAPAKIEYGEIEIKMFHRPAVYVERIMPAVSKVMTRAEFDALPKQAIYMHETSIPEIIKTTEVIRPIDDIAEFDYVYWPDGSVATREVKTPNARSIKNDEILEPVKTERIQKTFIRPDPVKLPDGRLRVVLSPSYAMPLTIPGKITEITERYIQSRTPAKYQLSFCN